MPTVISGLRPLHKQMVANKASVNLLQLRLQIEVFVNAAAIVLCRFLFALIDRCIILKEMEVTDKRATQNSTAIEENGFFGHFVRCLHHVHIIVIYFHCHNIHCEELTMDIVEDTDWKQYKEQMQQIAHQGFCIDG